MAISNLTGQKTYQSFRNLMQISSSGQVYDGLGNLVTFLQLTSSFASGSSGGTGAGFPFSGSAVITGSLLVSSSLIVTGSLRVQGSITGSLFGTSSWAQNSISSSYPLAVTGSSLVSTYVPGGIGGNTNNSIFIGSGSGQSATGASNSNFLGFQAGRNASNASFSNFLGAFAGQSATTAQYSNFFGNQAGLSATFAQFSNFLGSNAGLSATNASNSNFFGNQAGQSATNASYSNFFGTNAGYLATSANNSNFLGISAGQSATNAFQSNFIGSSAGQSATSANNSNFFGSGSGFNASSANNSNFLGANAGKNATNASFSNFIGYNAGELAINATNSNFIGNRSGYSASFAIRSNFLGIQAGFGAASASYSTLIGFRAGSAQLVTTSTYVPSIGSNNIIIGTNITLESGRKDSINLGAIIFATGSYSEVETNVFSGSLGTGRVGINNPNPNYTLDVSGSVNFTGDIYQNGTLFELRDKYMWYNIRIENTNLSYNKSATVNPNQTLADLNSLLPYVYVDIIDQFNTITYTSLTFTTVSDITDFITNNSINFGHAVIYSIKNNTGNLRVGGVNLFSTQIGPRGKLGKVSSKRIYDVNAAGSVYSTLTQTLIDTLVDECSSIVPNFSANYVNQDQVEAIVAAADPNTPFTYFRFAPINKYKKRQFSRHYVGQTVQGIDVNGNIVTVSNSYQVKVLGVAVYEWYNNNLYFRSFITNYGYSSQSRQELGPQNTGGSMLNVYIVQTSDNCRALVIEPIGIDRIVVPSSFDKISDSDKLNEPELTIYRKGNTTEVASYQNRKDDLSIFTFLTPANSFSHLRENPIHEVDIINLYSDRTCDLFEKAIKLDRLKYTPKKHINLILLNSNYQKN